jgi:hypothetical protein
LADLRTVSCGDKEANRMSKFKEALDRGTEARRERANQGLVEGAESNAVMADFGAQARAWLNDVVVASLKVAKAEVVGEMTIGIDARPSRAWTLAPSVRFQLYRKRGLGKKVKRTFTVRVQTDGGVAVSAPGMVAKDVGNIGRRSDERFRTVVAELIEEAAKSM